MTFTKVDTLRRPLFLKIGHLSLNSLLVEKLVMEPLPEK